MLGHPPLLWLCGGTPTPTTGVWWDTHMYHSRVVGHPYTPARPGMGPGRCSVPFLGPAAGSLHRRSVAATSRPVAEVSPLSKGTATPALWLPQGGISSAPQALLPSPPAKEGERSPWLSLACLQGCVWRGAL